MNEKVEVESEVSNGRLTRNRDTLTSIIRSFEGKRIVITVSRRKTKRSNDQNSWYWGCAIPIIQSAMLSLGNAFSKAQLHECLKRWITEERPDIMLDEVVVENTGSILPRIKSTTELSTTEFSAYMEAVQKWSSENLDVQIPDPNEQLKLTND